MKRIIALIFTILFATYCYATPTRPITKNVATRVCGAIWNATTAKLIGAAPTGLDCEIDSYTDGVSADGFADLSTAEATVGTTGEFCAILTQAEANVDYALLKCTATNTDAADWMIELVAEKDVTVAEGGFGPKAVAFQGDTLAEGSSTLDLEASELSADDQFVGDKISLYDTNGKYYASSCITDSTNANERVTTQEDLSSLHTVGDSYIIRADAGCSALRPTTTGRTLDVASTGEAGVDLDNTVGTLAKTTEITGFNDLSAAQVNTEVDTGFTDYDPPTKAEMDARTLASASYFDPAADTVASVTSIAQIEGVDATDQINTAADTAIETYHLDHFFNADYDPASPPGVATALANELVESDGGVARFTSNALEQAPTAGGGNMTQIEGVDATDQIDARIDARLTAYDPPTKAEMDARTLVSASYFDPAADTVASVTTVTTLTGHTAQTGDSFARLGAPVGASLSADLQTIDTNVDDVETDTADMQPKLGTVSDLGGGTTLAANLSDMAGATFVTADDSQEAIRNRGDAAWTTGGGGGSDPILLQNTTIATLASQTSFTLTAGSANDDAYNGAIAIITDAVTSTQKAVGTIDDYTGSTKTITLSSDPGVFVMAATDTIDIVAATGGAGSSLTVSSIVDGVWDQPKASHNVSNSFGDFLDTEVSGVSGGGSGGQRTDSL